MSVRGVHDQHVIAFDESSTNVALKLPMRAISMPVVRMDMLGNMTDTVGHVPSLDTGAGPTGQSRVAYVIDRPVLAFDELGFWYGSMFRYELSHVTRGGHMDQVIRHRWQPILLQSEDKAVVRERAARLLLPAGLPADMASAMKWTIAEMVVRDSLPAMLDIQADPGGYVWVNEPTELVESAPAAWNGMRPLSDRWSVFQPGRGWLGRIVTPSRLDVQQIGLNYVMGIWKDSLGVDHVRLHRLIRDPEYVTR